jgi:cobalt-zinc-cadmium efflux system protein
VPASVDLGAVRTCLAGFEGVTEVHDLHIWAIGASETAMTVHLVMPDGHPGDAFIVEVNEILHDRFDIEHATIQIEVGDTGRQCRLANHVTA